jgi:hypothetical protein
MLNDRIRSVQVPRGLRVTLCEDANFGGYLRDGGTSRCQTTQGLAAPPGSVRSPPIPPVRPPGARARRDPKARADRNSARRNPARRRVSSVGRDAGPPPGAGGDRGDRRHEMFELRRACEARDTRAWSSSASSSARTASGAPSGGAENPELFWWERLSGVARFSGTAL